MIRIILLLTQLREEYNSSNTVRIINVSRLNDVSSNVIRASNMGGTCSIVKVTICSIDANAKNLSETLTTDPNPCM